MSEEYDCTEDVKKHRELVEYWMRDFWLLLEERAKNHDNSKLNDPVEKAMFDHWTPELRRLKFGDDEYKMALEGMGEGVKLHYKANRHHPEHFENGVNDMTLADIVEMVCDWMAAAQRSNNFVDLDYAAKRFGLSDQLVKIIANTLREDDAWNQINGVPVMYFCPPEMRDGHVEGFEKKKP